MSAPPTALSTASRPDWRTERVLFDKLNARMSFTLDAAADKDNALCERWFEGPHLPMFENEPCGLCADWGRETVWCNPPYDNLPEWIAKFHDARKKGATITALVPAATGTQWFKRMARQATSIMLLTGRVQFWHPSEKGGNNGHDSCLAYYHPYVHGPARISVWDWRNA